MSDPCNAAIRFRPTLGRSFRLHERCPHCGQWLRIRPDLHRAIFLTAMLAAFGLNRWLPPALGYGHWLPIAAMICVKSAGGWLAVRWLPMRHLSGSEMALTGYRLFLGFVVAVTLVIGLTWLVVMLQG
ncbi:MAG: hypothetical protein R3F15_00945 [Lysobacterales bacterium]